MKTTRITRLTVALWIAAACFTRAETPSIHATAILPLQERGAGVKGYGMIAADILFASLVANPDLILVDRQDMSKVFEELELSLSGAVSPGEAVRVGQLTGARILVTGSIIQADTTLYLVARIIGTETSRVLGESVKGSTRDALGPLVEALAEKVAATIVEKADQLVARPVKTEDRIAALNAQLGDGERPTLTIRIEEAHIGRAVIDPAAETEMTLFARQSGFSVLDAGSGRDKQADIMITGEGFSEFAMRRGNLVSVKARLEVKAVDRRTDEIIAIDRQTAVEVDLTEHVAGKSALQAAAAAIAERMLPKLVAKD